MSANTIRIDLGQENYLNPGEQASEAAFGAEFLGWEFFQNFDARHEQVDFHHVRWPGGIPVEDGINVDGSSDGSREVTFDLTSENYVTWDRLTGDPREGIREMLEFAVENDTTLAVVVPTARYVEIIREEGQQAGLDAARADIRDFTERLVGGDFGQLPSRVSLEIGSEYYSTDVWRHYTTDDNGIPYATLPSDLAQNFGDVFAAMTDEIDAVRDDPTLNTTNANLEIHVQLGRQGTNPNPNVGSVEDNMDFIESLMDVGALDAVDALIYHRYVSSFDNIDRGIDIYSGGNILSDTMQLWSDAAGGQEFDLTVGYLSPAAQSTGNPEFNAPGLTNILQFSTTLLANGMDTGSIFALGHSSEGSLGYRSDVVLGGRLYELMAESIPGTYVVDGYQDNTAHVVYGTDTYVQSNDVNQYVFQNDEEVVIFLAARDFAGDSLDLTLELDERFTSGELTRLWDSGETLYNPSTGEEVGNFANTSTEGVNMSFADGQTDISVTFNHDYEVLRLVLDLQGGSSPVVDTGPQVVVGTDAADDLLGSDSNDALTGRSGQDVLRGAQGNDTLNGNEGNDSLFGGEGSDTVKGGWGDDMVVGNEGDDRLSGEWGRDTLLGGSGEDTIYGYLGNDSIAGGLQDDLIFAGAGADTVSGGFGRDIVFLQGGDDVFRDTDQNNGLGDDIVEGGAGNDLIIGSGGRDTYYGNEGDNTLLGGIGDDVLFLSGGQDVVNGGLGNDLIYADADSTRIILDVDRDAEDPGQTDTILGFDIGVDFLEISGTMFGDHPEMKDPAQYLETHAQVNGRDLEISLGENQTVILAGVVSGAYETAALADFSTIFAIEDGRMMDEAQELEESADDMVEEGAEDLQAELEFSLVELIEEQLMIALGEGGEMPQEEAPLVSLPLPPDVILLEDTMPDDAVDWTEKLEQELQDSISNSIF